MFRALICPSSAVCEYVVELPHWLISFLVCCVLELGCGSARVVYGLSAARVAVTEILQGPILEVDVFTAEIIRSVCGTVL